MAPVVTLSNRLDAQQSQVAAVRRYPGAADESSVLSSRQGLVDALKRMGRGDHDAFRSVYAATSVKLFGIVLRILGRRDLAADVLQEVYIHVWQHAGDFDPIRSSPNTWLVTIARNRALDETRRHTSRSLDDCAQLLQGLNDEQHLVDHERDEDHNRLLACLDRLEPDRRTVFVRAYHYGMTSEEIARSTKRPLAAVKMRLRRDLAQIKDCLGQ